jgi:hypothetical protein
LPQRPSGVFWHVGHGAGCASAAVYEGVLF